MNRKIVVMLSFLLMIFSVGCSSEEDDVNDNEGICLSFRLLNEKGEETTTFNKGENIFFDLEIVNNCDTTLVYTFERGNDWVSENGISKNGADMLFPLSNEDFFCVFDKDDNKIGIPYSGIYCYGKYWSAVESHSSYHIRCPWKQTDEQVWPDVRPTDDVSFPCCKFSTMDDLPAGEYYVSSTIMYRKKANDPKAKFHTTVINYKFTVE